MGVVGRRMKVDTSASTVTGNVGLLPNGAGGYALSVELVIAVPGAERSTVQELVEKAHQVCPYSNAVRGNIDVKLTVAEA